jgi:hypothetical protein
LRTMNTLPDFANAVKNLSAMTSVLAGLGYKFKEAAPRTALDEQLIDGLVASAQELITAANDLKTIAYDPTPEEPV